MPWTYVINDLNGEDIVGMFHKKEMQRTYQNHMSNRKATIICLIVGL